MQENNLPAVTFVVKPTAQTVLGLHAGEGVGEGGGLTAEEEAALKQLGRALCRLGGVYSPVYRVH